MKSITKPSKARDAAFMTWLSQEEKKMLLKLAQRQGITMSSWVRKEVREAAILQGVWIPSAQESA